MTLRGSAAYPACAMKASHVFLAVCVSASMALPATRASADGRLRLMNETIPYTDVLDAADGDDPFDAAVHIDFNRECYYDF